MNPNSYIAILGRQPQLGVAELEARFGASNVTPLGEAAALVQSERPIDINVLGGSVKIARLVHRSNSNGWLGMSKQAVKHLVTELGAHSGKVTLGVSAYGFNLPARDVQKTGLIVKTRLKNTSGSLRLIPNTEAALSSAQVFHNKLDMGDSKREVVIVSGSDGHGYIGETIGVQNIDAYTLRDRGRPKRDALNGMLPPKLAQMMVNIGVGQIPEDSSVAVLDPFCGTGVVLQEAMLMGYMGQGTDLNPKMADFTTINLAWLKEKFMSLRGRQLTINQGDATSFSWNEANHFLHPDYVVSETYLGEPMAQEPSAEKLAQVMARCETVIRGFLENIAPQLQPNSRLCIAVPAWRIAGTIKHLQVVDDLSELGYNWIDFEHVSRSDLLYYREDQIVARELLVITNGADGSTKKG